MHLHNSRGQAALSSGSWKGAALNSCRPCQTLPAAPQNGIGVQSTPSTYLALASTELERRAFLRDAMTAAWTFHLKPQDKLNSLAEEFFQSRVGQPSKASCMAKICCSPVATSVILRPTCFTRRAGSPVIIDAAHQSDQRSQSHLVFHCAQQAQHIVTTAICHAPSCIAGCEQRHHQLISCAKLV